VFIHDAFTKPVNPTDVT